MRERINRYSPRTVRAGKVVLPKSLEPIKQLNFVALLERKSNRRRVWRVELSSEIGKAVVIMSDELEDLKKQHEQLTEERAELKRRLSEAQAHNQRLEQNNKQLLANIEADRRPIRDPHAKSPKNFLNVAQQKGFKVSGPTVQGGLPSLGKRR
jgi:septal ring factor EnvC (AmiA/AmiB activator)